MKQSNFGKFILLWAGELISSIGGGLTSFGLGVYVFNQTGSAAGMAIVTLLGFLPTLLLSVPAGVLADRYDRRLLMMLGDGCSAMGIIYILICMLNGGASLPSICAGVFISSVFQALLEPSYRATVTDLLTPDEYSRASGLVSLAGNARYLISPVIAGLLLAVSDVTLLLIIDICTFFVTVASTFAVKRSIKESKKPEKVSFKDSIAEGWNAIRGNRGIFVLVIVSAILTLFIGVFQILAEPMILAVADASTLGIAETICASGMLLSGLFLGIRGLKGAYVRTLSISLALAGAFIIMFGLVGSIPLVVLAGFGFFLMLPFANNCLDYLLRTNTPDELQGRVWGLVGFVSQVGYVIAYGLSGFLADMIGRATGGGVGRGAGLTMAVSGVALIIVSLSVLAIKELKGLEANVPAEVTE